MPRASRDGVSIYYERDELGGDDPDEEDDWDGDGGVVFGASSGASGDPDPVVFVQGLGYGRWMWRWQREALRGAYEVLVPDNRGTGRSDDGLNTLVKALPGKVRTPLVVTLAGYTIEGMADDLEAVLDDADVWNVHLVGASMGGMIAMAYALEYSRVQSLTLLCTSHGGPDAVPIPEETRAQIGEIPKGASERQTLRHRMRPAFSERFTNRNPHLMDRIVEWRLEQDADEPAREAQTAGVLEFDVSDRLGRIAVPTLVMHGSDDRVLPVANGRLLDEKIPNSRYVEIDGGSHLFFIEEADRVNEELRSFLDGQY